MMMDGGMMMQQGDPKAALVQFCQRFCKRSITKMDIQYNSAKVHPNGTQATVKLHCLQGQEFAGEICNNARDAEKSAAQQALQFYAVDVATLPMGMPDPSPSLQMPRSFGAAEAIPGMGGISAQQLLAMSSMQGPGQGRPGGFQQPGQGGFNPAAFQMMGQGPPAFQGSSPAPFTMPGAPAMGMPNPMLSRPSDMSGGGKQRPGNGVGGKQRPTPKGQTGGARPGGKGTPGGGGPPKAPGGKANPVPAMGRPKPAPVPKAAANKDEKDDEAQETSKSGLNVACMKLLKRPMQKGEIVYDSPQVAGGFQSIVRLPCLPGQWGTMEWAGKVSNTRKAAEQDAAEIALQALKSDAELGAIIDTEVTKSSKKGVAATGESANPDGKGKGKGKGGMRSPDARHMESKFQVKLDGQWKDYDTEEDKILKRAYMVGSCIVEYTFRNNHYRYDFSRMLQQNVVTGKYREIRRPRHFPPRPKSSILPIGPMVFVQIKAGQPGTMITLPDPNNAGQKINVFVPPAARVGSKMAIPIPRKGESVAEVQEKQKKHAEETKGKWSTTGKIAATGAALVAVGAIGVGGVILGDHLAGGDMAETIGATAVDVGEDVGEAIGDFAEDAVDWLGDAGEDAIDWLGDAGEDVGDFIMDLF
mmetsp:Transcript_3475/g.5780  ORF Transcript_3475/g.5780 Transcript_3475/m.5780 type:complete len:642 (-) Transcript_3475:104-2029(-)